jgi:uncharacterized protein (TIGR02231 family)
VSEIQRVTFFEDRAEVVRRENLSLAPGVHRVTIEGLALFVDDTSLQAGLPADAPGRVLGAKVLRRTRVHAAATAEEILAIEKDLERARALRVTAEHGLARAQAEESRVGALFDRWTAALERVPRGGIDPWKKAHDSIAEALTTALDEVAKQSLALDSARLDEQRAILRLKQGRELVPRYEAAAEVQVELQKETRDLPLDITYRTPLALWRPEHTARLVKNGDKHELILRTTATVWQRTGEEWRDVRCRFSTARPAAAASPPLLSDDVLSLQRKQDRGVTVEARDEAIATAGLDRGARAVEEMPGVEDGGEPLSFEAARPVTIPSDGRPFRVDLGERRLPCTVDVVVHPEKSEAAHLRATATLSGAGPLLAGPVRLGRGSSIVGRAKTAFVAVGEPFELGFGVDDGLRVRRRVDEERDTTPVIGTQKRKRTIKLYVSNLGGDPRRLKIIERVPVSELDDVKIEVVDSANAHIDKDGIASIEIELPANGNKEISFAYRIEAAAKVRLSF